MIRIIYSFYWLEPGRGGIYYIQIVCVASGWMHQMKGFYWEDQEVWRRRSEGGKEVRRRSVSPPPNSWNNTETKCVPSCGCGWVRALWWGLWWLLVCQHRGQLTPAWGHISFYPQCLVFLVLFSLDSPSWRKADTCILRLCILSLTPVCVHQCACL